MKGFIPRIDKLVEDPNGLDEKYVIKHFLGLDRTRVKNMLKNMVKEAEPAPCCVYTEDLMWMAEEGFSYYLPSFVEAYKESYKEYGEYYAEDLCTGMLCSISCFASFYPECILRNRDVVLSFLEFMETEKVEILKDPLHYGYYLEIMGLIQRGGQTGKNTLHPAAESSMPKGKMGGR